MPDWLTHSRLPIFLILLVLFASLELMVPKVRLTRQLKRRLSNIVLQVINTLVLRLAFPAAAVGVAIWAQNHSLGLLNNIPSNLVFSTIASLLLLDLAIYAQHRASHAFPLLWRLHRVHHSDLHIDVTTALRFHPVEILLSMLWKSLLIITLGFSPISVMLFEIILSSTALFNHSNIALPQQIDRLIRKVVVTPDMHRIHHSSTPAETNSNYGFNLPWWDKVFGSYTPKASKPLDEIEVGLKSFRTNEQQRTLSLLLQPAQSDQKSS